VLVGDVKYTSLQPILNVASPDVQASHGAKVHRIPLEKLFYMQSRGLSIASATEMIVYSYMEQILKHFSLGEEERKRIEKFVK
jgi:Fe-S cluster assembly protein SufD